MSPILALSLSPELFEKRTKREKGEMESCMYMRVCVCSDNKQKEKEKEEDDEEQQ